VALGGAGPLHAARLAKELEIRRILVPRTPGIFCALGLLLTDLRADFARTRLSLFTPDALPDIEDAFAILLRRADEWFVRESIASTDRRTARTVDMRYAGQNYEIAIPLPEGPIGPATYAALADGFAAAHQRLYGFVAADEPVQLVTFRVEATGVVRKAEFRPQPDAGPDASAAVMGYRDVWLAEAAGFVSCPVYDRDKLHSGNRIVGPAIVEQMDATTLVLPDMAARVEPYLNLILEAVA
jgi:N-methylhydantoinase A